MDKSELTDEEYAKRKADSIAFRNKKRYSDIFVLCASIFLILETMLILLVFMIPLFALFSYLIPRFGDSTGVLMVFEVLKMIAFIGGLILGFLIFRKVTNFVIRNKHLEDKLTENVKSHYMKKTIEEREMELRR